MSTSPPLPRRRRWAVAALGLALITPLPHAKAAGTTNSDGVVAFGAARLAGTSALRSLVAVAPTTSGGGYWLADSSGEIEAHGDARDQGSPADLRRAGRTAGSAPVVALVRVPSGGGYWAIDAVGGVFGFGAARYFGSLPGLRARGTAIGHSRVVAMAATPTGRGYWLVDDQGGIFTFGDARYHGSLPGLRARGTATGHSRVVAMAATPTGRGYWLVDDQGGIFTFGDARYHGSVPGLRAAGVVHGPVHVVAMAPTSGGGGYWLASDLGGVFTFGNARYFGADSEAGWGTTGLAARPDGSGYWLVKRMDISAGGPPVPAASGTGRRIVYSNSAQRVWLVEADGRVFGTWPVSGRRGVPSPSVYHVFSKARASTAHDGALRLDYMTRFAHGDRLAIGFHGIPVSTSTGRPIQTEAELGQYRSAGCVRQRISDAARLFGWAPVGTTVVVLG